MNLTEEENFKSKVNKSGFYRLCDFLFDLFFFLR